MYFANNFLLTIMMVLALPLARAETIEYYQPSLENECIAKAGKFTVRDSFGVPNDQLSKIQSLDLDQGDSGLCSLYSGFVLLQMHEWQQSGRDLGLPHLLALGTDDNVNPKVVSTTHFLLELHDHEVSSSFQIRFHESKSVRKVLKFVDDHFRKNSNPLSLGFCPYAEGTNLLDTRAVCNKQMGHAVTIAGVRKACCDKRCIYEWNLVNSYGQKSDKNGWHQANPLAWSSTMIEGGITEVTHCGMGRDGSSQEECTYAIQGAYPVHYLARAGNAKRLANFLASSKKEDLPRALNDLNLNGYTPLIEAIVGAYNAEPKKGADYVKVVQTLLTAGADPEAACLWSPLWTALTALSTPDIAWVLIQNNARFFLSDEDKAEAQARLGPNDLSLRSIPTLEYSSDAGKNCPTHDPSCIIMDEKKNNNVLIIKERLAERQMTE